MKLALLLAAACAPAAVRSTPSSATSAAAPDVGLGSASLGTSVATLAAGSASAIVDGPFAISSIDPGRDLELAVGSGCAAVTWLSYSGGGVVVGPGQTLCAHNLASSAVTHGFSGRRE